jgi:hypothetical protein
MQEIDTYFDTRSSKTEFISRELLANPICAPDPDSNILYCRFPLVESLLCILAARCSRPCFGYPCGHYDLDEIRTLVSLLQ